MICHRKDVGIRNDSRRTSRTIRMGGIQESDRIIEEDVPPCQQVAAGSYRTKGLVETNCSEGGSGHDIVLEDCIGIVEEKERVINVIKNVANDREMRACITDNGI